MKKILLLMLLTMVVIPVEAFDSQLFDIATKVTKVLKPTSPIFVAARNVGKACAEELNENGSQSDRDGLWYMTINALHKLPKTIEDPYPFPYPIWELLNKNILEGFIYRLRVQNIIRGLEEELNSQLIISDAVENQLRDSLKVKTALKELGKAFAQECNDLLSHSECSQVKEELKSLESIAKNHYPPVDGFYILVLEEWIINLR